MSSADPRPGQELASASEEARCQGGWHPKGQHAGSKEGEGLPGVPAAATAEAGEEQASPHLSALSRPPCPRWQRSRGGARRRPRLRLPLLAPPLLPHFLQRRQRRKVCCQLLSAPSLPGPAELQPALRDAGEGGFAAGAWLCPLMAGREGSRAWGRGARPGRGFRGGGCEPGLREEGSAVGVRPRAAAWGKKKGLQSVGSPAESRELL